MILWSKKDNYKHPTDAKYGISGRRWALEVEKFYIQLVHQKRWNTDLWDSYGARYYALSITPAFAFGYQSFWHDGEHEVLSLGFLHFAWSS